MLDNLKQRFIAVVVGAIGGLLAKVGIAMTPGLADTVETFAVALAVLIAAIVAIVVDRLLEKTGLKTDEE
jgi:hypothetical protein